MTKTTIKHDDYLTIAGQKFNSRLIIGTGKYKSFQENKDALVASGAEIITVALRRVNVLEPKQEKLQSVIDPKEYVFLPNTAGCYSADDAVRTLRLAREAGGWNLIKLEVIGNSKNLFPDMEETLKAAKTLLADGFEVMVYSTDDPIYCQKLEDLGVCAIMPLAAPIGSGLGIQNKTNLRIILENANIPVIVDAGVGTASDATIAMEMGCDAVLMNTAIAEAKHPILMAQAMKQAVESGRLAYLAGRMPKRLYASASSPSEGLMDKIS